MSDDLKWPEGQKEYLERTRGPEQAARYIEKAENFVRALKRQSDLWRNAPEPPWEIVLPLEYTVAIGIVRKYLEQFPMLAREVELVERDEGYRRFAVGSEGYWHFGVAPHQQTLLRVTAADPVKMRVYPDTKASLGSTMDDLGNFIFNELAKMQQQSAQTQAALSPQHVEPIVIERASTQPQEASLTIKRRGRKPGSLTAGRLPPGTKIADILPFLREAQRAREAKDGSFSRFCKEHKYPESTVRTWLTKYAELLRE